MAKQVITFHYELKGEAGEMIDSSRGGEPIAFLEGSSNIIVGLEEALLRLAPRVQAGGPRSLSGRPPPC